MCSNWNYLCEIFYIKIKGEIGIETRNVKKKCENAMQ